MCVRACTGLFFVAGGTCQVSGTDVMGNCADSSGQPSVCNGSDQHLGLAFCCSRSGLLTEDIGCSI